MLIGILKFVCLAVAITYTFSNVMHFLRKQSVDADQLFIMGGAWAGFITLQWLL